MQKKVSAAKPKRPASEQVAPARRPQHPAPPPVYALRDWSVRRVNGNQWQISPTAHFEDKPQWSKSYATLQRATTAIARKLAEEVMQREERRRKLYGVDD